MKFKNVIWTVPLVILTSGLSAGFAADKVKVAVATVTSAPIVTEPGVTGARRLQEKPPMRIDQPDAVSPQTKDRGAVFLLFLLQNYRPAVR